LLDAHPYILFNKSPEQMRQLGACGGRAYGRNQRARRALVATPPQAVPPHGKRPPKPSTFWTPSFRDYAARKGNSPGNQAWLPAAARGRADPN
jgi:hypothetical protein